MNREAYHQKDELIDQIISEEYRMFSRVENVGGRAVCQDDFDTFYIMRFAQHSIFGVDMLASYQRDIRRAKEEGRNMVAEKYAWMMEETDPAYFEQNLRLVLAPVSGRKQAMADSMTEVFMSCYEKLRKYAPQISGRGRLPYDNQYGASICLYLSGELKTWSEDTLELACRDLIRLLEVRINPVGMIYQKTLELYSKGE